ncbi:MAG: hypothetical protein IKT27_02190, partial [Clostridia bacterium]|nr:hypothetical protein [Clostridia bacterium]
FKNRLTITTTVLAISAIGQSQFFIELPPYKITQTQRTRLFIIYYKKIHFATKFTIFHIKFL